MFRVVHMNNEFLKKKSKPLLRFDGRDRGKKIKKILLTFIVVDLILKFEGESMFS